VTALLSMPLQKLKNNLVRCDRMMCPGSPYTRTIRVLFASGQPNPTTGEISRPRPPLRQMARHHDQISPASASTDQRGLVDPAAVTGEPPRSKPQASASLLLID
jgi:hypothetical protein